MLQSKRPCRRASKGLAAVATVVKSLATQTAAATEQIGTQIGDIRSATQSAVSGMSIGTVINEMRDISMTISGAVEEQGAATKEIARKVKQAATMTEEVTTNIIEMKRGAEETGLSAEVLKAAEALSRSGDVRSVDHFLGDIKTA